MDNKTNTALMEHTDIKDMIYVIRGQQVMLDSDLAELYGYEVKQFNRQVRRNIERFPDDFMFQLSKDELGLVKCQNGTALKNLMEGNTGGRRTLPYAFTEQGIYMLSSVLRGEVAVNQSIMIMRAFKEMRHYINENRQLLNHTDLLSISNQLIKHEEKIKKIDEIEKDVSRINQKLDSIAHNFIEDDKIKQFIIMDGQKFEANEAYAFIYKQAKHSIYIIDDYINIDTLTLLKHKKDHIDVIIFSDNKGRNHGKLRKIEYDNFNREYPSLIIKKNNGKSHDRYIILDYNTADEKIYHCGASSKDAGNKLCGINQIIDIALFHSVIDELQQNDEYIFS